MKLREDKIFVVDLEATCWNGDQPEDETSDIIEIGICTLHVDSGDITDKESFLVKPQRSNISTFCTELTTIDNQTLKGAHPLPIVTREISNKYACKGRIWAAWGEWDRKRLEKECRELNAEFPFGKRYLNVKTLFAISNRCKEQGLGKALKTLGWEFEGTHHRGHDDAWNTARILRSVLWPTAS